MKSPRLISISVTFKGLTVSAWTAHQMSLMYTWSYLVGLVTLSMILRFTGYHGSSRAMTQVFRKKTIGLNGNRDGKGNGNGNGTLGLRAC